MVNKRIHRVTFVRKKVSSLYKLVLEICNLQNEYFTHTTEGCKSCRYTPQVITVAAPVASLAIAAASKGAISRDLQVGTPPGRTNTKPPVASNADVAPDLKSSNAFYEITTRYWHCERRQRRYVGASVYLANNHALVGQDTHSNITPPRWHRRSQREWPRLRGHVLQRLRCV